MEDRVLQQCSPMGCSCDEGWVQDPCWHYLGGWALWVASLALVVCPHTIVVCFPVLALCAWSCYQDDANCWCIDLNTLNSVLSFKIWLLKSESESWTCKISPNRCAFDLQSVCFCVLRTAMSRSRKFLPGFWFGGQSIGAVLIGGRLLAASVEGWVLFQHLQATLQQDLQARKIT